MLILKGHRYGKPVRDLAFTPDGKRLASAARDYVIRLWDLDTGSSQVVPDGGFGRPTWLAFAPDGKELAWDSPPGIRIWDLGSEGPEKIEAQYDGAHPRVDYSPDGRVLAAAGATLRLWDARTRKPLPLSGENAHGTSSLAFAPDGRMLATGHAAKAKGFYHHSVRLWDTKTWKAGRLFGHTMPVTTLAFMRDSRALAATCGTSLLVWDVASGKEIVHHKIDKLFFTDVAFTPNGRFLLVARNDSTVRVWSTESWREHTAFAWELGPLVSVAVAPDGMRAAAGSDKGKIVVWDLDL
ncbi:MAG: WD40 repeat domain-containing protein [Gemmataceae bacterium]|nr:WD40 repeat domain-containing protein [Gemmataceae bacterium]